MLATHLLFYFILITEHPLSVQVLYDINNGKKRGHWVCLPNNKGRDNVYKRFIQRNVIKIENKSPYGH